MTLAEHLSALVDEREVVISMMRKAQDAEATARAEWLRGKSMGLAIGIAALRDLAEQQ